VFRTDKVDIYARVLYRLGFAKEGGTRTWIMTYIPTDSDKLKGILASMLRYKLIKEKKVKSGMTRGGYKSKHIHSLYYATKKGEQYLSLVREAYRMLGWEYKVIAERGLL